MAVWTFVINRYSKMSSIISYRDLNLNFLISICSSVKVRNGNLVQISQFILYLNKPTFTDNITPFSSTGDCNTYIEILLKKLRQRITNTNIIL